MTCAERSSHCSSAFEANCSRAQTLRDGSGHADFDPDMSTFRGPFRSRESVLSAATRRLLLFIGTLIALLPCAQAACIDPSTLVKTTVSIFRNFDEEESKLTPGIAGIAGTAWFLSPRLLVTAAHVAETMPLSSTQWKDVEIWDGTAKTVVPSRIKILAGPLSERMALLDLLVPFSGADSLSVRREPLLRDEQVVAVAFPKRHLRFAGGRFVAYGTDGRFAGAALMEIYAGHDRLVLDHGASGAPVLDCQGKVVAVVSSILTQTLNFGFRSVKISTAWQTPNVISMPAGPLASLARSDDLSDRAGKPARQHGYPSTPAAQDWATLWDKAH